jgi:hypothetical protein
MINITEADTQKAKEPKTLVRLAVEGESIVVVITGTRNSVHI